MDINAALVAELAIFTQALDEPGTDLAATLLALAADARTAVASYLGLTVIIAHTDPPISFTAFVHDVDDADIRTSLMLAPTHGRDGSAPDVSLILFAATPGAFVDLAADLRWMPGHRIADLQLDQHLTIPADTSSATPLHAASVIDQARGLLIGLGHTPERADRELDARAAAAGTDRYRAAELILTTITAPETDPDLDIA